MPDLKDQAFSLKTQSLDKEQSYTGVERSYNVSV